MTATPNHALQRTGATANCAAGQTERPPLNFELLGAGPRFLMNAAGLITAFFLSCATLSAGSHVRATTVIDGFFYPDPSKQGVYHFESKYGTEHFDISGQAFLTASGVYPPEIPGLRAIDIRAKNGKMEIREKDAASIRALVTEQGPSIYVFRAADMGLFYVRTTGKTPVRKITIESERGDSVILWRNRSE